MKTDGILLDDMRCLRIWWVMALIPVGLYAAVGGVFHITFPGERVGIEQVRVDVARAGCVAAEDAVGLAIQQNRTIKSNRYWAHNWFTGLAVPNGWDDITLIEIPNCQ